MITSDIKRPLIFSRYIAEDLAFEVEKVDPLKFNEYSNASEKKIWSPYSYAKLLIKPVVVAVTSKDA